MNHPDSGFIPTKCAICETSQYDEELYPANFQPKDLSFETFSARRVPDRIHYRMVRCRQCGLVRSNPILDEKTLISLYQGSHFTYAKESVFAAETYADTLKKALVYTGRNIRLLEIGCGNGSFLRKIKPLGFKEICGIEPSGDAVANAGELKSVIQVGMFGPGIYPNHHFDIICAFQVFDHISQPNTFLSQCHEYLRPGGVALFIHHDAGSLFAKLFGERCPIIDIEHTNLYDKVTTKMIFSKNGFEVLHVFSVVNCYPLSYWLKLTPLPQNLKKSMIKFSEKSKIGTIPIKLAVGNMGIIARTITSLDE